jgi:hypothetical protein
VTFEQLIDQQRPHIERVVMDLARRHYLAASEVDEFRAAVHRALERNDHELLRAFDGRSTWETYLGTVITREFFVFERAMWGSWRPSPEALRLGPAAILLEELVRHERLALSEALEVMRTMHRVDVPRVRLLNHAQELHLTAETQAVAAPGVAPAMTPRLSHAVRDALSLVSGEDRLILELRFRDRYPLTRIAALMKIDVRPLQRRIERVQAVMRESLLTQGIDAADVATLLPAAESGASASEQWWQAVLARPSRESNV